ncbi:MAG: hypothetical protein IKN87_05845 [Bacilli bacterium]|nr:hypothetical protein [Bacilli bacterium]
MYKYYPELNTIWKIKIYTPITKIAKDYTIPPCYYINPNGDLCNGFGDNHKKANVLGTYKLVKDAFFNRQVNINNEIKYVSLKEIYIHDLERLKKICQTNKIDVIDSLEYLNNLCCDLDDPKIVALTIGNIKSRIIFLEKFIKLEETSKDKKADLQKIIAATHDDINDILVRYCNFNKIEPNLNNVITTASLNFSDFENYLVRNWTIDIVPKLDLENANNDDTYTTMVLNNYLDKNPEFADKIKIIK